MLRPPFATTAISFGLAACGTPQAVTQTEIKEYMGLEICRTAEVHDLTTPEERNTTPGFSYHIKLQFDPECADQFKRQLQRISPVECAMERVQVTGCWIQDAKPQSGKHTSVAVHPLGATSFDVRFSS
ncbi:hypothetical protein [Sphingobium estronivorans]|uniref:hypothetical protein n=1 Tax=Sphingobium estronivorans TaxID=1577690 RepID=UPI00123A2DC1|nr:hypothetical protein [Sphingobium estronivorans]